MLDTNIQIRELHSIDEARHVEELQRLVWEMPNEREVVPLHLLVTVAKNGGLLLGAFDGGQMIGFLFGFPGRAADGRWKHCSHQLGVLGAYRGRGIGETLKQRQRELVLAQGLDLITWTYDPLQSPNAHLNIAKLGAVCNTYLRNVYGELDDELNRGMPTDRFQVDWWLRSERVTTRLRTPIDEHARAVSGSVTDLPVVNHVCCDAQGTPEPASWELSAAPRVLVEIPAHIQLVRQRGLALARCWRRVARDIFEAYFADGYTVVDFVRYEIGGRQRAFYIMERNE